MVIPAVDVDGVLACFNTSYRELIKKHTGIETKPVNRENFPDCWDYDIAAGVTKEQSREMWKHIATSDTFWRKLPPYEWTEKTLNRLLSGSGPVYFITSRCGQHAQKQTQEFLERYATNANVSPSVLVVSSHEKKIPLINGLGITHYIDDRMDSMKLFLGNVDAKLYLFDQPWNREPLPSNKIKRIVEMGEFLDEVGL